MTRSSLEIAFLGGLGSIGRNCMALKQNDEILLIDCGIMFPKEIKDKDKGIWVKVKVKVKVKDKVKEFLD